MKLHGIDLGIFVGTLMTFPEEPEPLKRFYRTVNPWGFWRPIRNKVLRESLHVVQDANFKRDTTNVVVGIARQVCLVLLPIYTVLKQWVAISIVSRILAMTTLFLRLNWYDKLEKQPSP